MKKNKPYISIKAVYPNGKVKRIASRKTRRIFRFIEANIFQDCVIRVSVVYSPGFYNKGVYESQKDLTYALKVFLE
jgi:hypothetical protein